jgi:hypothetical protein
MRRAEKRPLVFATLQKGWGAASGQLRRGATGTVESSRVSFPGHSAACYGSDGERRMK